MWDIKLVNHTLEEKRRLAARERLVRRCRPAHVPWHCRLGARLVRWGLYLQHLHSPQLAHLADPTPQGETR